MEPVSITIHFSFYFEQPYLSIFFWGEGLMGIGYFSICSKVSFKKFGWHHRHQAILDSCLETIIRDDLGII